MLSVHAKANTPKGQQMNPQIKVLWDYLASPKFSDDFMATVERDRLAGIEWRRKIVNRANANAALEGLTPDAQMLDMQEHFIAGELDTDTMLKMVRETAEKAGETLHSYGIE
jgi:hypothetical protein